jgi:hypothetical protein
MSSGIGRTNRTSLSVSGARTQLRCVQHDARRAERRPRVLAHVAALTQRHVAGLGEVDADLVRAAGLQAAGDQCRAAQPLDDFDVRDRFASQPAIGCRATQAVAAVGPGEALQLGASARQALVRQPATEHVAD